ncbi:MAG: hypothetical protein PUP93_19175 [Rhizonema sp. NSF051]|nr:hypothetical protein [Rhizonema sp. NSF051]
MTVYAISKKYEAQYPEANTQVWKEYTKINLEHLMRACFEQADPKRSEAALQVLEENRKGYKGMLGSELFEQTIAVYQMMHGHAAER